MTDSTLWPKGHIFINMMPKGTFLTAVERGGNDNSLQHSSASPPFLALQNKRHCSRPEQPCQTGWDCLIPSPCFLQLAAAGNQIPSYLPMALPCLQRQEYSLAAVAVKAQLCWATSSPSEPGNEHRGGKGVGSCTTITVGYDQVPARAAAPVRDQAAPFFYSGSPLFHSHIVCVFKASHHLSLTWVEANAIHSSIPA